MAHTLVLSCGQAELVLSEHTIQGATFDLCNACNPPLPLPRAALSALCTCPPVGLRAHHGTYRISPAQRGIESTLENPLRPARHWFDVTGLRIYGRSWPDGGAKRRSMR